MSTFQPRHLRITHCYRPNMVSIRFALFIEELIIANKNDFLFFIEITTSQSISNITLTSTSVTELTTLSDAERLGTFLLIDS